MSDLPGSDRPLPHVVAVLVVTDGEQWLPGALATLARTRYPALELVVVDNASRDSSGALLNKRIPADRLLRLTEPVGFGRAVAAALTQFDVLEGADYVWLLHDDLVPTPDALARLVDAIDRDEAIGVVGPKLREWSAERLLQEVGMTIDRLGRAESQLDIGELDQGQHDTQRGVLYVSTAGMLLRRSVFSDVGGFDPRFALFRDDLDLCWRTWLAGLRVEVVPSAVAYHIAAASRRARQVGGSRDGARYYAERHSLATLIKNYGLARLLALLPIVALVGLVKIAAFLATRRFGDALATVRAYAWNIGQIPRTLRRRRRVQQRRAVSDGEIMRLFAPGLPRLRTYTEALGSWLAGGSTRALIDDDQLEAERLDQPGGMQALVRALRAHPAVTAGTVLGLAFVLSSLRLLGGGQIVGGEIAPWPADPLAFFTAYLSPWVTEPLGSAAAASPVQAVLGLLAVAGLGSAWLAQRIVVLGLLPLAWLIALRAGRLVTVRAGPRVLGATLYVISPVVLGAFAHGRLGALTVAALAPGLLLVGVRAADADAPASAGWRSAALLSLGLVVAAGADPTLAPLPLALALVLLGVALLRRRPARRSAVKRIGVAVAAAAVILAPWVAGLVTTGATPLTLGGASDPIDLWRALGTVPAVLPGLDGPAAWLVAATSASVALAAVVLGLRARPAAVSGLLLVWTLAALAAWSLGRLPLLPGGALGGLAGVWAPAVLLPAVVAQAGLGVLAARWASDGLGAYAFGARQVITAAIAIVLLAGLGGGIVRVASGPWSGLVRQPEVVPAFVGADIERVGPYRVLLLAAGGDGRVSWDVTTATGPRMTGFGAVPSRALVRTLDEAVGTLVSGVDPQGGAVLGVANVRYVVVPASAESRALAVPLDRQPLLEPLPAGQARVYRVRTWLPRAAVVPGPVGATLAQTGSPGDVVAVEEDRLERRDVDRWVETAPPPEGGLLILGEGRDARWRASGREGPLERVDVPGVNAFAVPAAAGRVTVGWTGGAPHTVALLVQLVLALALASLVLRPPGTSARRAEPARLVLPDDLETEPPATVAVASAASADEAGPGPPAGGDGDRPEGSS